jgi:hypothetical protein
MPARGPHSPYMGVMKTLGRILLIAIAYVAGCILTGIIAPFIHLPQLRMPAGAEPSRMFLAMVASTPLLAIGVLPLSAGLRGIGGKRFFALSALLYVTIGLNTMIEAKIFSTVVEGSAVVASLYSLLPCVLVGAVLAFGHGQPDAGYTLIQTNLGGWTWRVLVAWLSFPVIYWTFGMCVGPFVIAYYNGSTMGLRIPAPSVILTTQLLRSVLLLAASVPVILLWRKSRQQFIVALGLAYAFAIGIFQLASATFMPARLRILHSLEITADSFAYAALLGYLFIAQSAAGKASHPVHEEELVHTVAR